MHSIDDSEQSSQALSSHLSGDEGDGLALIRISPRGKECSTPNRPFLIARDDSQKRLLIYRPSCKLWACPECSQHNRRQWTARIASGVREYQEAENNSWWFVTLSVHEKLHGFEQQHYVWKSAWLKLSDRMRRAAEGKLRYVLLPELAPETDRFHVHGLFNQSFGANARKSPKKGYSCSWLHDNPRECGLGYANDITPIKSPAAAAAYTAGYIGKALGVINWPVKFRRIRTSNDWPELPEQPTLGDTLTWQMSKIDQVEAIIERAWKDKFDVINVATGEMFEVIDLEEFQRATDVTRTQNG